MTFKLELTYPEMALIRKLLSEHKADDVKSILDNSKSYGSSSYQKYIHLLETETNEFTHLGKSNNILNKIQEIENKIKE
jgi:hypothetical protein